MTGETITGLAVSILTHNSSTYIDSLVDSLEAQTRPPELVVAVDNGSDDDTVQLLRKRGVHVLAQTNCGVGAGHTSGLAYAFSNPQIDFVLLLEHDAFLASGCLELVMKAVSSVQVRGGKIGAFACQAVHPGEDNELIVEAEERGGHFDVTRPSRITFNGLLLPWQVIESVGYPRSDYFVGQEDADYYRRLTRTGQPVYRVEGALVAHHGKGRRRRGNDESLMRRAYSKRNSTYRDAMLDGHLIRAIVRLAGHATRGCLPHGSDDRALAKATLAGMTGRLGALPTLEGPRRT